ncbi:MAG: LysR substrate-binding domain-containing protein [Rikenellaceae bacterium]
MIIDFRLHVFVTVVRSLSFTRAAALLNVSQPAISKHIKELESDFGEPLFNRQGNRISLTQKARDILPTVEAILEGYDALNNHITSDEYGFEGTLHIGASTTIAQYVLPMLLARFNHIYPNINLSVISANSDDIIGLLQRKEIEIALIEGDNTSNQVHYREFASDEIVLVSTRSQQGAIPIEKITDLPLLIREEGSGTLSVILAALRSRGIGRKTLNVKLQLGSSEAIIRYLINSSTYAFLSILVAKEHVARGELNICEIRDFKISRKFRFATLHGHSGRLSNLFQSFCEREY